MRDHLADAFDEARRGLWRSAAESFAAAAVLAPDDPGPRLAQSICLLNMGDARAAVVLLETSLGEQVLAAAPDIWRTRHTWLCAAARLAAGDARAVEQAARQLPRRLGARVLAHALLAAGDYAGGVDALLSAFRARERT